MPKNVKQVSISITRSTVVNGKPVNAGEIVETSEKDANFLCAIGKAKHGTQVTTKKAEKTDPQSNQESDTIPLSELAEALNKNLKQTAEILSKDFGINDVKAGKDRVSKEIANQVVEAQLGQEPDDSEDTE